MNRIVLIGNGFDLAHGLKTRYEDFVNWYWDQRLHAIVSLEESISADMLCSMKILPASGYKNWYLFSYFNSYFKDPFKNNEWKLSGREFIEELKKVSDCFEITYSPFFERIIKSIETKGWVDVENEYYSLLAKYSLGVEECLSKIDELNEQLFFLQNKLVEYLGKIEIKESIIRKDIRPKIYAPFKHSDIAIGGQDALKVHVEDGIKQDNHELDVKFQQYGFCYSSGYVDGYRKRRGENEKIDWDSVPKDLLLPNQILLLNFNYTKTAQYYCKGTSIFTINQIHGEIEHPESVIFGYGDELDEDYKKLMNKNENRCLNNIKSIKYLESDNYRKLRAFIEAEPYQICIMGHSCGNSDRTLLNTLFEHKNCVSIKPYYYIKEDGTDNYLELVQNISRNFTDMKLMRDRVVNKTYCEPLTSHKN